MMIRFKRSVKILICALTLLQLPLLPGPGSVQALEVTAPEDKAQISLMRKDWQKQIAQRKRRPLKALDKVDMNDRLDLPEKIVFAIKSGSLPTDAVLEITRDQGFVRICRSFPFSEKSPVEVADLEVGRTYYWQIRSGKKVLLSRSFSTLPDTPRFIAIPGGNPANVRDLGGKRTLDGRRTVQSKIYRGTEMHNHFPISEAGIKFMLQDLKIKSDLDFRYPREIAKYTQSALGKQVKWVTIPINAYKSFTPEQNNYFRNAIRFFADPAHYPIYMHCSGGVDRTGEIAYLLNMILNVDEETALLDYEASSLSVFPRKRSIPYFAQWRKTIADMSPAGTPPQQQAINYLKKIGVTDEDIKSIRNIMLEK